jgi:sulfite reductase beta subunit-like hemoprotein
VADAARQFGNGEARATNTQNFVLRWIPEERLVALHRALGLAGLAEADAEHITDVVACPGGDYCTLAITRSMKLGADIREHLAPSGSRVEADDMVRAVGPFAIKISGCPNACGQHQVADIGMTGLMVKGADGVERPHYSLRVGGGVGQDARIGERLDGRIPEEDAPRVVAALAKHYVEARGEGESFREFATRVGAAELTRVGFAAAGGVI